jgi:tetratricopeptide (TPR) repeat protein
MSLFRFRRPVLFAAAVAALAGVAPAHDFVRDSAPMKWVEQAMTEDLPPLTFPGFYNDFDKAKAQVDAGRYKTALLTLRKIKNPKPEQLVTIALCKGRALAVTGQTNDALTTLNDATVVKLPGDKDGPLKDHPQVQLLRVEVLAETGRFTEALAAANEHLAAHPQSWGGHYWAGEVLERLGDTDAAKKHYDFFASRPGGDGIWDKWISRQKLDEFESAENVTWMGRAIDRWATLNEKYSDNSALANQVLNTFIRVQDINPKYWQARVAAAEYFMERDDRKQAGEELGAALKANPQDVRALRLVGQLSLGGFNFDRADAAIDSLRKFDPNSVTADLLEARNLLLQRRPKDAEAPIQRVLSVQPRNIEALGLLAGAYALQLQDDKVTQILEQVDAIDVGNNNATAYLEVAEQLSAMRQYPRAEAMYLKARERAPWWTAAWNGLGLLYTQWGEEDKAHATIAGARKLDPFNLETTNYQKLLDMMQQYTKVETEHFVLIYDKAKDPILHEYFPEYLESIHATVAGLFKHEPHVKTYIEVFPSHDAFSVRTTGSPWIGTVGASTGRVIAMVSPRKGGQNMAPFNWAAVLRHEYAHTVTLAATDNRIQHWMTEGLAVLAEDTPVRWDWVPMLNQAVRNRELFTMENLTWGFVRPKKPTDRQLAYAQSWWICLYIQETHGHSAILKMLDMFRDAGRQEDVFPAVTGKPIDVFYKDFLAWCDKQVAGWGYDKETTAKYEKLREKAERCMERKDYAQGIEVWEEIVKIRPVDAMPHTRLAGLYLLTKQYDKAIAHLEILHRVEIKDNRYALQIARIHQRNNALEKAHQYGLQAVYIDPYDLRAHELLRDVCRARNDAKGLEREERVIATLNQWYADQEKEKAGNRPPVMQ